MIYCIDRNSEKVVGCPHSCAAGVSDYKIYHLYICILIAPVFGLILILTRLDVSHAFEQTVGLMSRRMCHMLSLMVKPVRQLQRC